MSAVNDDEAAKVLERITEADLAHVCFLIAYVRSVYLLARIQKSRGEREQALESYQRFVDLWGDGEIDRERIEEARTSRKRARSATEP